MNQPTFLSRPQCRPGITTAEEGLVVLDGPDGVAVTMTADAAAQTGHNLISAAALARTQSSDGSIVEDP